MTPASDGGRYCVIISEIDEWRCIKTKGRHLGAGFGGEVNAPHIEEIAMVFGDIRTATNIKSLPSMPGASSCYQNLKLSFGHPNRIHF